MKGLRPAALAVLLVTAGALTGCSESWYCSDGSGPHFGRPHEGERRCSEEEMRRAGYHLQCEDVFVDRWTGTEEECFWVR